MVEQLAVCMFYSNVILSISISILFIVSTKVSDSVIVCLIFVNISNENAKSSFLF